MRIVINIKNRTNSYDTHNIITNIKEFINDYNKNDNNVCKKFYQNMINIICINTGKVYSYDELNNIINSDKKYTYRLNFKKINNSKSVSVFVSNIPLIEKAYYNNIKITNSNFIREVYINTYTSIHDEIVKPTVNTINGDNDLNINDNVNDNVILPNNKGNLKVLKKTNSNNNIQHDDNDNDNDNDNVTKQTGGKISQIKINEIQINADNNGNKVTIPEVTISVSNLVNFNIDITKIYKDEIKKGMKQKQEINFPKLFKNSSSNDKPELDWEEYDVFHSHYYDMNVCDNVNDTDKCSEFFGTCILSNNASGLKYCMDYFEKTKADVVSSVKDELKENPKMAIAVLKKLKILENKDIKPKFLLSYDQWLNKDTTFKDPKYQHFCTYVKYIIEYVKVNKALIGLTDIVHTGPIHTLKRYVSTNNNNNNNEEGNINKASKDLHILANTQMLTLPPMTPNPIFKLYRMWGQQGGSFPITYSESAKTLVNLVKNAEKELEKAGLTLNESDKANLESMYNKYSEYATSLAKFIDLKTVIVKIKKNMENTGDGIDISGDITLDQMDKIGSYATNNKKDFYNFIARQYFKINNCVTKTSTGLANTEQQFIKQIAEILGNKSEKY
jgi:hypothetical protein